MTRLSLSGLTTVQPAASRPTDISRRDSSDSSIGARRRGCSDAAGAAAEYDSGMRKPFEFEKRRGDHSRRNRPADRITRIATAPRGHPLRNTTLRTRTLRNPPPGGSKKWDGKAEKLWGRPPLEAAPRQASIGVVA